MCGDYDFRIYPIKLEIKDTTDTGRFPSWLELQIEIDSEDQLRTKPFDTRDVFNSLIIIVNLQFAE